MAASGSLIGCARAQVGNKPLREPTDAAIAASERMERQQRAMTVVDAYSACVNLDDLEQGGVDVVIQAVESEEILARIPDYPSDAPPPPGANYWENIFQGDDVVKRVRQTIDRELEIVHDHPDRIALALTCGDIERIVASERIAFVLMLKSSWINGSLETLRMYHKLGLRVMAVCHHEALPWADSSAERNAVPGLSAFGREMIHECNRIGVAVDVSHSSDETVWHTLEEAKKPLVATHSGCRALSDSPRDLTDDMLRAIAKTGGVVGIHSPTSRSREERSRARLRRDRRLVKKYKNPFERAAAKLRDAIVWATKLNLEHIDHAVRIAGVDHVALASHCVSVAQWREFNEALTDHGYREAERRKLLGTNMLRALSETIG